MTMTTTEAIAAVEGVLAQLRAAEVAPLAAGAIPPQVAAGELITSAWGNAVADEEARLRGEVWAGFTHGGGSGANYGFYDCGVTTLQPFTYGVQMVAVAVCSGGYGGTPTGVSFDVFKLDGAGASIASTATEVAAAAHYVTQTIIAVWNVAAGGNPSFKTRCNYVDSQGAPNTCYFGAYGNYFIKRTGLT
jgi:hypothetical protein